MADRHPDQAALFPRAAVQGAPAGSIRLGCRDCAHTWTPAGDCWQTGATGCPNCGGWTFLASYGWRQ